MPPIHRRLLLTLLLLTVTGCSDSSSPEPEPTPEVSFIRPRAGQDFSNPLTVEIAASAVDSVTLQVGDTLLEAQFEEPFQWTVPLEMMPAGEYPLKVRGIGPGGDAEQEIWVGRHYGQAPLVGDLIPDFHLPDADGTVHLYSDLRAGRPALLNFWASWCPPCRTEMPALQTLFDDYTTDGLHLLGIGTMEEAQDSIGFVETSGLTFPNLYDPDQELYLYYRTNSIPRTFLIGADGVIRHAFIGGIELEEIRPLVEELLGLSGESALPDG